MIQNADLAVVAGRLAASVDDARLRRALVSYDRAWTEEFSREHDHFRLLGQDNLRRYLPFGEICVRVMPQDTWFETVARIAAARVTGARVLACFAPGSPRDWRETLDVWTDPWAAGIELFEASDEVLIDHLQAGHWPRIRYAARDRVPLAVRQAAIERGHWLADVPVLAEGRIELLWYLREQSISYDYHRYGNLGPRAQEPRRQLVER